VVNDEFSIHLIATCAVDMVEFGMTRVQIGLFQHALAHSEANSERFESIEAKLDELRSYLVNVQTNTGFTTRRISTIEC
jgi:hypothetical protein